jgi:hypothetical protein
MEFSFSNLLQGAKDLAAEKFENLENLVEENVPGAKGVFDKLHNAHLGDISSEVMGDLKSGKYMEAGQAVMGKIKSTSNLAEVQQTTAAGTVESSIAKPVQTEE